MKIKDALIEKGEPFEIPDANRLDLPHFFVEMGYKVGVEIGTAKGVYAEELCKAGLKLYAVDPWLDYPDYHSTSDEINDWQEELERQYQETKDRLKPYDCTILKFTSMEALKLFKDESLDFVYIDGNHEFKYVVEDIYEWSKKVRKGGCISGHDYLYTMPREWDRIHVKHVLPAYTKAYGIKPWYVVGRRDKIKGEKRDGFRSWFWVKQ